MTDLSWLLEDLQTVPGVRFAIVSSSDGMVTQAIGVARADAERFAASTAGLRSLAESMGAHSGGPNTAALEQVMVQWDQGFMFVRRAAQRSDLTVVADGDVDPGIIASRMAEFTGRLDDSVLASAPRTAQ